MDYQFLWKLYLFLCISVLLLEKVFSRDDFGSWHRTLSPFQAHACDDEELVLRCSNSTIISIHFVYYGRRSGTHHLCPAHNQRTYSGGECDSLKALEVIRSRCHQNRLCRLHVSPGTFREDPCPGVRKYVEVMYKCRPDTFLNRVVCEGGHLNLSCPLGQALTVFSASYGTAAGGVEECGEGRGAQDSEDCLIENAGDTARSLCSGREHCYLRADDKMFGNPGCSGKKYLKVAYNCVEKNLLLPARISEDAIQTTSFPAWAQGVEQSTHSKVWLGVTSAAPPRRSVEELQSDEVPTAEKAPQEDQRLVGFMSRWKSAHNYVKGNQDKLILYLSVSLTVGLLVFVTVLGGRCLISRLDLGGNRSGHAAAPDTEDQFFSDSDLEQFDPVSCMPPPPALPPVHYTASMKRHDSDTCPRAPLNGGSEHYFT